MVLLVGVDGGGSKTRALVADGELRVLGTGAAGSSNVQAVGLEGVAAAVGDAVAQAMAAAGTPRGSVAAACLGLAGVGRPEQRAAVEAHLAGAFGGAPLGVVTDLEPVLAAGTPAGWGVALIAGTGSSCLGRAPGGELLKVGGWGHLLGDEGSGYDLARRALALATRTADGRASAETILRVALARYDLASPDGLVARAYADTAPATVAALARPVVDLAEAGDPDARALLDESAVALALMATTAARRLGLTTAPVALAGGLIGASLYLRNRLAAALAPALAPVAYVDDPARGALILAHNLLAAVRADPRVRPPGGTL